MKEKVLTKQKDEAEEKGFVQKKKKGRTAMGRSWFFS